MTTALDCGKSQICPCASPCPLQDILGRIGGKWKIPILCSLHNDGPIRYNELKRKVSGITNTMLAHSLKELEETGLILRHAYLEMPLRVEYEITAAAQSLMPILSQLSVWGTNVKIADPE